MTASTGRPGQAAGTEGLRVVSKSVGILAVLLYAPTWSKAHSFHPKRKNLVIVFLPSRSAVQIPISPGVLEFLLLSAASFLPKSIALGPASWISYGLTWNDQATSISIMLIAWTSTTITIKTLEMIKHAFEISFGSRVLLLARNVNLGKSVLLLIMLVPGNVLALYAALIRGQLFWPWVVFPEGGPCQ